MISKRKASVAAVAAGTALVAMVASAAGPNMVKNGDFAQGTTSWHEGKGVEDAMAISAGPGQTLAVEITTEWDGGYAVAAVQCVKNIQPDTQYLFEADAFIPGGQDRHGSANLFAFGYDGTNCNGYSPGAPSSNELKTTNTWTHLSDSFVPPVGSRSVAFYLRIEMAGATAGEDPTAGFRALFDNASFTSQGPATEDPAFWPEYQGPQPKAPLPEPFPGDIEVEIPGPLGHAPEPENTPDQSDEGTDTTPPPTTPGTPGTPDQPQTPGQSGDDEPADQPQSVEQQPAYEVLAPLPPDTGTGLASDGSSNAGVLAGALLVAASGAAAAGALNWARDGRPGK